MGANAGISCTPHNMGSYFSAMQHHSHWQISLDLDNVDALLGYSMAPNLHMDGGEGFPAGSCLCTSQLAEYLSHHVDSLAGPQSKKLDRMCRLLGSLSPVPEMTSETSPKYTTIFHGTLPEQNNKP